MLYFDFKELWLCFLSQTWNPLDPNFILTPCFTLGILPSLVNTLYILCFYISPTKKSPIESSFHVPDSDLYNNTSTKKNLLKISFPMYLLLISSAIYLLPDFFNIFWISVFLSFASAGILYRSFNTTNPRNKGNLKTNFYFVCNSLVATAILITDFGKTQPIFGSLNIIKILSASTLVISVLSIFVIQHNDRKVESIPENINNKNYFEANFISLLTYSFMNKIVELGKKRLLIITDLFDLPQSISPSEMALVFEREWIKVQSKSEYISVIKTILFIFWKKILLIGLLSLASSFFYIIQPIILGLLINFLSEYSPENTSSLKNGYIYAISLFLVEILQLIILQKNSNIQNMLTIQIRGCLVPNIYKKTLTLKPEYLKKNSIGKIVNTMNVDTNRIARFISSINQIWYIPVQIISSLVLLYINIGYSTIGGILAFLLIIPLNGKLIQLSRKSNRAISKHRDERIKKINELVQGIKMIKFFSWEEPIKSVVEDIRNNRELAALKTSGEIHSLTVFVNSITPVIISGVVFGSYYLFDNQSKGSMDAELIFVTLLLLNRLREPLRRGPFILAAYIESSISVERVHDILSAASIKSPQTKLQPNTDKTILLETTHSGYGSVSKIESTNSINLHLDCSDTDSITKTKKILSINSNCSNVTQNQSEQDGYIIANKHQVSTDQPLYDVTCENAKFAWDSHDLDGIQLNFKIKRGSLVGVVGKVGSGKSSLINAILGEMDLVSGHMSLNGTIGYTPQVPWLMNTSLRDNIIFGCPFEREFYEKVINACALTTDIESFPAGDMTEIGERGINLSGGQKARISLARAIYSQADIYILDDPLSAVDAHVGNHLFHHVIGPSGILKGKTRIVVTHAIHFIPRFDSVIIFDEKKMIFNGPFEGGANVVLDKLGLYQENNNESTGDIKNFTVSKNLNNYNSDNSNKQLDSGMLTVEEVAKIGSVKFDIYKAFVSACGFRNNTFFVVLTLSSSLLGILANYTLKRWADTNTEKSPRLKLDSQLIFLIQYLLLGVASSFLSSASTFVLRTMCALRAAKLTHTAQLDGIVRSPLNFFESTPSGRIINRFSQDQTNIDSSIPREFSQWITSLMSAASSVFVISIALPAFMLFIIPIFSVYWIVQSNYLDSSRQITRMASRYLSPLYSHFFESVAGIYTIRAYRKQNFFCLENFSRLGNSLKVSFNRLFLSRWISVRIGFIGTSVVFLTSLMSVMILHMFETGNAPLLAMAIVYAIQFTGAISRSVQLYCDVEIDLISVERVGEYTDLPSEQDKNSICVKVSEEWPKNGKIEFRNVEFRYRPDLDPALKNVSFEIKGGEKIGVVGRTGAGKSTLTLVLFQLVKVSKGSVFIDNIDISQIDLYDLRSRLSIIPQDPVLFSGTLRYNLDPFNEHSDENIWDSLDRTCLKEYVTGCGEGLEMKILSGGENMSVGQRQLLCLARALLKKSKILVLDEATATIDIATDRLLQETLKTQFVTSTVITIAHRLDTIADCDRILLVQDGDVTFWKGDMQALLKYFE
ncbi:hypothetical protein BB559_004831 [Furculomyces boomerangus]|uniref:Uncharacterized protein n=1 Tax=Furculomyces boomerangus TaxID=61424 RepID=A0A2T9YCE3_9FUNG|nr:hypothetical protein BB559_004831 [Furculomyces boomerangus]